MLNIFFSLGVKTFWLVQTNEALLTRIIKLNNKKEPHQFQILNFQPCIQA